MYTGEGSTPVPDPTTLTNELVSKANAALREVLEAKIDGLGALMKGQFEAQDKATKLLEKWRDGLPLEIKAEVEHRRIVSDFMNPWICPSYGRGFCSIFGRQQRNHVVAITGDVEGPIFTQYELSHRVRGDHEILGQMIEIAPVGHVVEV